MNYKNYWESRHISNSKFIFLKKISLFRFLFSCRAGDESYLMKTLIKNRNTLDIACGAGKSTLVDLSENVIGIDIEGYPRNLALSKGYRECLTWSSDMKIITPYKFSCITIINLNAHIDFKTMEKILNSVRNHMESDTKIIFINEHNNDNLLYRFMKKDLKKFKEYVNGCEHHFFDYQSDFQKNMSNIEWLVLEKSEVIAANPPFLHVLAFLGIHLGNISSKPIMVTIKIINLIMDVIISQINNFHKGGKGFIVGYCFKIK